MSLMKKCESSDERLMRECVWSSFIVIYHMLIRLSITLVVFWFYRNHNWETVSKIFWAMFITEMIVFVFNAIRGAIGKSDLHYVEYYETIFGRRKEIGEGDLGPIRSFLVRQLEELIFLAILLVAYATLKSRLEEVMSTEQVHLISIGIFSVPYLKGLLRIIKFIYYYYRIKNNKETREDKRHNDLIRISNHCAEAPDVIYSSKGIALLLILLTWPLRVIFGTLFVVVTFILLATLYLSGFGVLIAEAAFIIYIVMKDIVPAVQSNQMTTAMAFSYWPQAVIVILASVAAFFLIKYKYNMTKQFGNFFEGLIDFRYGRER